MSFTASRADLFFLTKSCWINLILLTVCGILTLGIAEPIFKSLPPLELFDCQWLASDAEFGEKLYYLSFCAIAFTVTILRLGHASSWQLTPVVFAFLLPIGLVLATLAMQFSLGGYPLAALVYLILLMALPWLAKRLPLPEVEWAAHYRRLAAHRAILLAIAVLAAVLWPADLGMVAENIGFDLHPVFYLYQPALHVRHGEVPGLDFFAQYGAGMGWAFQWLIAGTAQATVERYTLFIIFFTGLYFFQLFLLYRWLLRSWGAALALMSLALLLAFHSTTMFFMPSESVLRAPLLPVTFAAAVWWFSRPDMPRLAAVALLMGMSVFLNTETGIITLLAVTGALWANLPARRAWRLTLLLMVSTVLWFAAVAFLVFGPRTVDGGFYRAMLEPLWLYGAGGLNAEAIRWEYLWQLVANMLAPVVAITLLVWQWLRRHASAHSYALALICLLSLLLYGKYLWRSAIHVWAVDASWHLLPVVILIHLLVRSSTPRIAYAAFLAAAALLIAHCFTREFPIGLQAWLAYPAAVTQGLGQANDACKQAQLCWRHSDPSDVALINDRLLPGQPAAILDELDWTYVIDTHRPPFFAILPATHHFVAPMIEDAETRLQKTSYIFTGEYRFQSRQLEQFTADWLQTHCRREAKGLKLTAWRCEPQPNRAGSAG